MKRSYPALIALLLILSVSAFAQINAVPQLMNFQGRLTKPDGTPVPNGNYSIRFSLWNVASGGSAATNEKWNQTINPVTVRNGVFAVVLNTSTQAADKFNGNLWLEIKIGTNAPLTPRQQLASVAYAMKAESVKDNSITSNSIVNGSITANDLASGTLNPLAWLLTGNANPSASNFLGTTTNHPLTMKVNNYQAMQYLFAENASDPNFTYRSVNILGGSNINTVGAGVVGATIAGGGRNFVTGGGNSPNSVNADFGTVGGGLGNSANGLTSTVAGGRGNTANSFSATVAGGNSNLANANESTVGGGHNNAATGQDATVGGGGFNTASGFRATIPGGNTNTASGVYSFAAGNRAAALHDGSFVWADSQNADFASTGANQFMVRAAGGIFLLSGFVGIGTNAPVGALHVKGFQGALNLEGTSNHVYMQFFPRGVAQGRKAYIGFPSDGSHDFEIANEDTGVLRVRGTFVNSSDARWKTNVLPIDNALDGILNLRGVSYDWKHDVAGAPTSTERQVGLIAQEVEKVFPALVHTDEKGYKSVNYIGAVPVLVEAMKAQQKQMEVRDKRIAELEARLKAIENALLSRK